MLAAHGLSADQDLLTKRRTGRTGTGLPELAEWAERYLTACATTTRPFVALAYEHPGMDPRTIKHYVTRATDAGLLLGRTPGRAGGRLSAKAKRLLAASEKGKTP
jgi:hypothetical protein